MNRALFLRTIAANRVRLLACGLGLLVWGFVLPVIYATFGKVMKQRFKGWRVGIITTDKGLAKQTTLPFLPPGPPVLHGGLRVTLWQTGVLR